MSVKLIYQLLYLIDCFLFFRCPGKGFEEEKNKNKDGNSRGVTKSQLPQTEIGMMKFLALTSYLLARITLTLMSSFATPVVFKKSIFRNLTYVLIKTLNCHLHYCMRYVSYQKNRLSYVEITEAAVRRCSVKKVLLEISQSSQESTSTRDSFLIKFQAWPATLLKKNPWHKCFLWHKCFPVNFAKFLRTPFLQNTSGGCF